MPQILWVGCWESDEEFKIKAKKGYNLASAQVSQKNLLNGIEKVSGILCDSINGSVLPPYPVYKDRVIRPVVWEHKPGAFDISVGYKNDKYINRVNCKAAMIKAADKWINDRYKNEEIIVFVYSMRSAPMATACHIKERIPQARIYLIVTDLPQFMDLGQSKLKAVLKKIDWKSIKKMQGKYTIYPKESRVMSIGADGSGVNYTSVIHKYDTKLIDGANEVHFENVGPNKRIQREFRRKHKKFLGTIRDHYKWLLIKKGIISVKNISKGAN